MHSLRPLVRGQTRKYNRKLKYGRGFSLEEVRSAGLNAKFARTIGISVDHRRTDKSTDTLADNVSRLKTYLSKLILFPRREKFPRKGVVNDASGEKLASPEAKQQNLEKHVLPMQPENKREKATPITKEMKDFRAYNTLRLEKTNAKYDGLRRKAAEERKDE